MIPNLLYYSTLYSTILLYTSTILLYSLYSTILLYSLLVLYYSTLEQLLDEFAALKAACDRGEREQLATD